MTEHPDRRLVLVDGNNFVWRAFYAIPARFRADGLQVNAVYGFVTQVLKRIVINGRASHVAIVFDPPGPSFRRDLYIAYKANRPEPPVELTDQLPVVRTAADAFSVKTVEAEGFEADDLIASYTDLARHAGLKVSIVSSDKDLGQLVDDAAGISIYNPAKKTVLHAAEVEAQFGVPPERVPDVQALAGDVVDGVPGVPRVGIKTAAQLIRDFGSLETLLARAEEIPQPGRRRAILENREIALLSRDLVTLRRDAPCPVDLDALRTRAFDAPRIRGFLANNDMTTRGPWS